MIERGLRLSELGSARFTWAELKVIVKHLPESSAYWRAREPERSRWGFAEYMLASIADSLRWLVWAKTRDAKRGRNRPKPIPRPGDSQRKKDQAQGRFRGAVARPIDEVKRILRKFEGS